jgi:UDP-N-acetylglucosamine 2-epimerase (non-hydrolysing)
MHRPATVDNKEGLTKLCNLLQELSNKVKVLFPIHPRTKAKLIAFELLKNIEDNQRIIFTEPLDYFAFQNLISNALFIVTDSGGIQEETTFKKIPCLTLRENTERPITIELGTNILLQLDQKMVMSEVEKIIDNNSQSGSIPEFWDGKATKRILKILLKFND